MQKFEYYRIVEDLFKNDLNLASESLLFLERIQAKEFDLEFINAIVMKQSQDFLNIYDAHVIKDICNFIDEDLILYKKIYIGHEPYSDKLRDENNAILSKLPFPFEAEFSPNSGARFYNDGYFKIKNDFLEFDLIHSKEKFKVCDFSVPLEVGTTEGYTSFNHIVWDGGLARWPYYSQHIHLFYKNFELPSFFSQST